MRGIELALDAAAASVTYARAIVLRPAARRAGGLIAELAMRSKVARIAGAIRHARAESRAVRGLRQQKEVCVCVAAGGSVRPRSSTTLAAVHLPGLSSIPSQHDSRSRRRSHGGLRRLPRTHSPRRSVVIAVRVELQCTPRSIHTEPSVTCHQGRTNLASVPSLKPRRCDRFPAPLGPTTSSWQITALRTPLPSRH